MLASDFIDKTFVVTYAHYAATNTEFIWKEIGDICIIIDAYKEGNSFAWVCLYASGPAHIYTSHDEAGTLDPWLEEIK